MVNGCFHSNFPSFITDDHLHINCLELLVVIVAVKNWGKKLKGIFCDNEASVTVINSGSTKDSFIQNCLSELNFVLWKLHINLKLELNISREKRTV